MKVSAQYAETHFPDILEAAENGEEIVIARPGKPSLVLVPRAEAGVPTTPQGRRVLGAGRGEMRGVSDEEWQSMKEEMEHQMVQSALLTTGEI